VRGERERQQWRETEEKRERKRRWRRGEDKVKEG